MIFVIFQFFAFPPLFQFSLRHPLSLLSLFSLKSYILSKKSEITCILSIYFCIKVYRTHLSPSLLMSFKFFSYKFNFLSDCICLYDRKMCFIYWYKHTKYFLCWLGNMSVSFFISFNSYIYGAVCVCVYRCIHYIESGFFLLHP